MTHYISDDIFVTIHSITSWYITICDTTLLMSDYLSLESFMSTVIDTHVFLTHSEEQQIARYYMCFTAS